MLASSRFTLVPGLVVLALLGFLGATLLGCAIGAHYLTCYLVKQDAERVGDLARFLLARSIPASYATLSFPATRVLHESTLTEVAAAADVVRVVLYDATGRVLWSDDATLIGRQFLRNRELDSALLGETESYIIRPGREEHQDTLRSFPRLVETYLPVRFPEDGPVVGVLEIYRHPPNFFEILDRGQGLVWVLGASGVLLLAAPLLVARRVVGSAAARGCSIPTARRDMTGTDIDGRPSEEFLRILLASLRDVVCTLARDGKIVSLNSAFETVTGWSRAEWLSRPFMELVHPDDAARVSETRARPDPREAPAGGGGARPLAGGGVHRG